MNLIVDRSGRRPRRPRRQARDRKLAVETMEGRALLSGAALPAAHVATAAAHHRAGHVAGHGHHTNPTVHIRLAGPATATLSTAAPRKYSLMDEVTFKVKLNPAFTIVADAIELKKPTDADWTVIGTSNTDTVKAVMRVAGNYEVRANVAFLAIAAPPMILSVTSTSLDVSIQFPGYADITGNADVKKAVDDEWAATKKYASDNKGAADADGNFPNSKRREQGFWITLDTATGKYGFAPTFQSGDFGPDQGAGVDPGAKPADVPNGNASAVYTVGLFHTHTPTTYRTVGRAVGPSGADNTFHTTNDVVGVVYDYTDADGKGNIPAKHPLNSAAQLYSSGPTRRKTPRN